MVVSPYRGMPKGLSMSISIDKNLRSMMDLSSGKTMTDEEWSSVRQCIRCMKAGDYIDVVEDNKKAKRKLVKNDGKQEGMDPMQAVVLIVTHAQNNKVSVVEAARKMVFTSKALKSLAAAPEKVTNKKGKK